MKQCFTVSNKACHYFFSVEFILNLTEKKTSEILGMKSGAYRGAVEPHRNL